MKKLSSNIKKIIESLNDGKFHSGNILGEKLGITRTAIWKAMKQLNDYGLNIESNKNKGYRMAEPCILLEAKSITQHLHNTELKKDIQLHIYASLDSTNEYLKNHAASKKDQLLICLAEQQTAGKARLHRQWLSPFGANIYYSCSWHFKKDLSELAGLSLVISLALVHALEEYGISDFLKIKWPNDVMYQDQKLAGILIEVSAESHGSCDVIIGIGLNVNMTEDSGNSITQGWTSLKKITQQNHDRNKLVALLTKHLFRTLHEFEHDGFNHFKKSWQQYDLLYGKMISITQHHQIIKGKASGINSQGNLLLQQSDGNIVAYSSGDTSINKK